MIRYFRKRRMRKVILLGAKELRRHYGRNIGCSRGQLERFSKEQRLKRKEIKYLQCCFLSEEDLSSVKRWSFFTNWKQIEKESDEILKDLQQFEWRSDFHESHIGCVDV